MLPGHQRERPRVLGTGITQGGASRSSSLTFEQAHLCVVLSHSTPAPHPVPVLLLVTVCGNWTNSVPAQDNIKIRNIGGDIPALSCHFPEACVTLFTSSLSDTWPSRGEAVPGTCLCSFPHAKLARFPRLPRLLSPDPHNNPMRQMGKLKVRKGQWPLPSAP